MGMAEHQSGLDEAFDKIEEAILPSMSMMLDMLIDAASLNRPGVDAATYAAELRTVALQLESLTREVEALSPVQLGGRDYRIVA